LCPGSARIAFCDQRALKRESTKNAIGLVADGELHLGCLLFLQVVGWPPLLRSLSLSCLCYSW
jgi:hypothetical protein